MEEELHLRLESVRERKHVWAVTEDDLLPSPETKCASPVPVFELPFVRNPDRTVLRQGVVECAIHQPDSSLVDTRELTYSLN